MTREDLYSVIKNRRSIYPSQYNGKEIHASEVEWLLKAANWAPTHQLTEPWRFYVLGGEKKDRLGDFLADKYLQLSDKNTLEKSIKISEKAKQSDKIIVLCIEISQKETVPEWEELASLAMAVQNMWLLCQTMEIGAYWSSPPMIKKMTEFLPLSPHEKCYGFFYMGKIDANISIEGNRKEIKEKVQWFL